MNEPIYQTGWPTPETVWGDVSKDVYDTYTEFGYTRRRIVYLESPAPIASAEVAVPAAWRYLTPTGWHATTKMDKALGASAHHDMEPLYTHPAAVQPSRAEVQLNAAYAALDAVADWAQQEDGNSETGSGTRLLALLLKHGVHPRALKDQK